MQKYLSTLDCTTLLNLRGIISIEFSTYANKPHGCGQIQHETEGGIYVQMSSGTYIKVLDANDIYNSLYSLDDVAKLKIVKRSLDATERRNIFFYYLMGQIKELLRQDAPFIDMKEIVEKSLPLFYGFSEALDKRKKLDQHHDA